MNPRFLALIFLNFLFFSITPAIAGPVKEGNDTSPGENNGTVFVKVTVSDSQNRYVTELKKEHFRIFEDGVEQEIVHISQEAEPISAGYILDISKSMWRSKFPGNTETATLNLTETGNPQDELFLIMFNQATKLVRDLRQQPLHLMEDTMLRPEGNTALFDAIYLGLSHIRSGIHDSKALILITDGEDNSSQYSAKEVLEFVKESNVQIHAIGEAREFGEGSAFIENITKLSGGRAFFPTGFKDLNYYIDLVFRTMRNQYTIEYRPTNQARDGKWHRIKVKLDSPEKLPKLKVQTREGYYAPSN